MIDDLVVGNTKKEEMWNDMSNKRKDYLIAGAFLVFFMGASIFLMRARQQYYYFQTFNEALKLQSLGRGLNILLTNDLSFLHSMEEGLNKIIEKIRCGPLNKK